MTMTESTRRAGKPLLKQPEIEEVEEAHSTEPDGSPNSDVSDATLTATETSIPVCIQSASDSPENGSPEDSVPVVKVEYPESRKGSLKLKLMRGEAVRDDASPPPPDVIDDDSYVYEPPTGYDTLLLPNKLEKQGSQGSDTSTSPCLSRDSSIDSNYKDSTGIDLVEFIRKTLNKSVKDKKMLLQLEKDFKKFIREPNHQYLQLPEMSSYDRMVVHRIAAFFGLDHNVDQRGKSVIVSKTKKTRVPDLVFEDYVSKGGESQLKRQILPRKAPSMDEKESKGLRKPNLGDTRAKSLEERQRSYDEHKARIFNGEEELQQQQQQQQHTIALRSSKCSLLSSKDDLATQPWSSTDSSGYNTDTSAPTRGRLLPKANSYSGRHTIKSESFTSHGGSFDSSVLRPPNAVPTPPLYYGDTSPTSSAGPMQLPLQSGSSLPLIIAPPDVRSIPPGSFMFDPQTMLPYRNPDGSYYQYDPKQPPPPWLPGATQQAASHHVHSQPTAVPFAPVVRQASVDSVGEVCQKLHPLTITPHLQGGDSVEVTPLGTPQPTHPPTIIMGSQQPYPPSIPQPQLQHTPQPTIQQPHLPPPPPPNHPYVASPYYPSAGMGGQQSVRYVYPMAYGQGECHNHTSTPAPLVGQYPQQYVPSYPNYQNVVHQGTPQTPEMGPAAYQPASVYPVSHTDNMSSYSVPFTPQSQQTFGQQSHSPVYYSIPQTASPQMAYTFTGQNSIRAATPPSQPSATIPNSNLAINVGQTFPYAQQGATPTPGATYTSYQPYPQLQFSHQPRPVNQVLQFPGIQSQTQPQGISVLRPGIPINMQPSSMAPNNIGQTLSAKGYQMTGCVHKSSVDKDGNMTLMPAANAVISAPPPLTPTQVFQHIQCANAGMVGPSPVRPQIQPLQFTTTKPQSTQSQVPKTRPVIPSVVSIRNPRSRKSSSKDSAQSSSAGSSSGESASNQNACKYGYH